MKTIEVTYREFILVENVKTIVVSDDIAKKLEDENSTEYLNLKDEMDTETDWYFDFDSKDTFLEVREVQPSNNLWLLKKKFLTNEKRFVILRKAVSSRPNQP